MNQKPFHKTVIVIGGPTAAGKTSLAIEVARHFDTEIISADSRQCYKELKIGVARPSEVELNAVPHHFIASHSIHEKITAAFFERFALEKASGLFQTKDTIVMVGGTGLYIKAFCEGMDIIPDVPPELRRQIIDDYNEKGMAWLQEEVAVNDPLFYQKGEIQNPQRLMRALEVKKATGRSIIDFRSVEKPPRPFRIIRLALELPRETLNQRINSRVDEMIASGLEDEVRALIPHQHLNALQTVGYKELFDYFKGRTTLNEAIDIIKKNTRQYAKRQMTWFRNEGRFEMIKPQPEGVCRIIEMIKKSLPV